MKKLNLVEMFPADIVELEIATRRALKAMRSGDPERMRTAFVRYMDLSLKMSAKPYEQIVADAQRIEDRGRIDLDDWQRIDAAMREFAGEPPRGHWATGGRASSIQ